MLAPAGSKPFDPLGLGLVGPVGAAVWLGGAAAFTAVLVGGFLFVRENEALRAKLEAKTLGVPGLGGCFRAFALHRFATAVEMTGEAGVSADRSIALALRATANDAYARHADGSAARLRKGDEISEVLEGLPPGLFPEDFLDTVRVGEMTGKLPEVMEKQAGHLRDEAARKMKTLAGIASGVVYAGVGLMIVILIFRIAMSIGGVYDDALKGL
jgi:type II secretory pathway component PulF